MKITFCSKKYSLSEPQTQEIAFGAGMTAKIAQEINNVDVLEISNRLAQKGIPTDFKGNKVVAWCSEKAVKIFEELNEKFGTKLALPKGIYVEDFDKLNIDRQNMYGFCNLTPTALKKGSSEIIPSRTLFFNAHQDQLSQPLYNWDYIDQIADYRYATKQASTDSFLDIFLHEFAHVAHEDKLLKKFGGDVLLKKILSAKDLDKIEEYQRKYGQKISGICNSALYDPFEAVACDMSKTVANSLDKETLIPTRNPFIDTPYEKLYFWQQKRTKIPVYSDQDRPLIEILRNFWNGKFE